MADPTTITEDLVQSYAIQLFQAQNATWDLDDKSFFGLLARAFAQMIMLEVDAAVDVLYDSVPAFRQDSNGTLLSRCSSSALDAWAMTYGLSSGVSGVYGRRGATGSSGGAGIPTTAAAAIPIGSGTQFVDSTGLVTLQTTAAITTDGPPNTQAVSLISATTGTAANLPVGSVMTLVVPIANVTSTMALTSALTGGQDRETDGQLLTRILFRLQNIPRGGTAADYRVWAESSTDATRNNALNNITRAFIFPLRSGLGSVDVVCTQNGSGTTRAPGNSTINAVAAYLAKVRPITATVNTLAPSMPAGNALRVQVDLLAFTKYAPDWVDGGLATGIAAINKGAKAISCTMPAILKAAVLSGANPRIEIIDSATGASPKPYQVRVLSFVAGAPDVMTVDSWPFPSASDPIPGQDYFYAGGPYVDSIASGILAYCDGLGPSRISGFADDFDVWEYEFTPARIADIVMETRDTDGTRMIRDIPNLGATGILIAVGVGAFGLNKFTPRDIGTAPEMAFMRPGGIEILGNS